MADILDHPVQTPAGNLPLIPIGLLIAGSYLAWFGVHYWRSDTKWPTDPIKAVLTGQPIPTPSTASAQADAQSIAQATAQANAAAQAAGQGAAAVGAAVAGQVAGESNAISAAALAYKGQGYVWGGPADHPGDWDCSSFVSYVLGHDLGMALPGGGKYGSAGYPPSTHGPTTLAYMMWGSPLTQSEVQPGDLIVSSEHMGVIISSTQYVSARDPAFGVGIDNFPANFPGGAPVYRRVPGVAQINQPSAPKPGAQPHAG